MKREKKLARNTIIYGIGVFGTKFITFLLLPLYTFYLSIEDYGRYDIIITSIGLIALIITMQLESGVYRFLLDCNSKDEIKKVISNSFFIVALNLVIFNFVYIVFFNYYNDFNFKYAILFQINFIVIATFFAQIARGLKYNMLYSINGIIITIVTIVTNIICLVFLKMGLVSLLYASTLANVISILYLNRKIHIFSYLNLKFRDKKIKNNILKYSLPLIPNAISWWFMNVSDRYMLNEYMGNSANGLYAIANKLPSIIMLVNYIFYLAWQESAITEYGSEDKKDYYTKMFNSYVKFQCSSLIVLLAFTPILFKIMVDAKFYEAYKYVPFLYMGSLFYGFSSFYGVIYDGSKNSKGAAYTAVVGAIFNIIFNIIMIPKWGIQAASFSTMISFFIMWILRIIDTSKYVKIIINLKQLVGLSIVVTAFIVLYYENNIIIQGGTIVLSMIIFYLINKQLILAGFKKFKSKIAK